MAKENKCKYALQCNIYMDTTETTGNQLIIYKNVFCHRGERGWLNCKEYILKNNDITNDKT